jgi:ABC-type transport system substrate-binding protein
MGGRQSIRRVLLLLVPALLVPVLSGVSIVACGGTTSSGADNASSPTPKQGGTYNYPLSQDPGAFDPSTLSALNEDSAVVHQLYEGLVRYEEQPDGTLKTAPCLAESWRENGDATVWTFRLRRGVMFQAPVSREVTAADVVADLRYIADPANKAWSTYMLVPIEGTDGSGYASPGRLGVEAVNRYTVRFTLKHPVSEFPDTLGNPAFSVWPTDYLQKVGLMTYGQHPVGTGPYMFQKRVPGTSIDLVRNQDWWDTSGGPYIDTIHYEVLSNISSMLLAFQKGMIDWTYVPNGQLVASRSLPQVKSGPWKAVSSPWLNLIYLATNMNDPVVGGTQGLPLRQALTYGCDRQAAIDVATDGVDLLPTGLVPQGVPGSNQIREPYPYGPAKAAELVKQTGPVTLDLLYPRGDRIVQATAETLTASYAKLGITLRPRAIEWTKLLARLRAGKSQTFLMGWMGDYPSMDNFLYPLFHSGGPNGLFTFYSNPHVDALLRRARATPDQQARVQLYAEAEAQILADAPVVPLLLVADYRLLNSRVANVRFNLMTWVDLWRAWVR